MRRFFCLFAPFVVAISTTTAVVALADDDKLCTGKGDDEAIAACTRLISDGSRSSLARSGDYVNRALSYFNKGDYDRTIADATVAIELDPQNKIGFRSLGYQTRGLASEHKGDYDRAIADYTMAIDLNPKNASSAYDSRGDAYAHKRDFSRAMADYRKALEQPALDQPARDAQARSREKLARLESNNAGIPVVHPAAPASPNPFGAAPGLAGNPELDKNLRDMLAELTKVTGPLGVPPSTSRPVLPTNPTTAALPAPQAGAIATAPVQSSSGRRVALVIGNSAYKYAPELANPKNDAADMATALKALGIEVIEGVDLSKEAMDRKIRDFSSALSNADTGIFFYAGHGLQVSGTNYLVPVDAELSTADALEFEMVGLETVQRIMEGKATTNILFLDACRNNPLARNLARAMGTRSAAIGRGLAPTESGVGTLISFSTQPGNVALDGTGRNSPFATALAKHIGASTDSLADILVYVRLDVMAATEKKQVPWEHSALTGRFYFKVAGR